MNQLSQLVGIISVICVFTYSRCYCSRIVTVECLACRMVDEWVDCMVGGLFHLGAPLAMINPGNRRRRKFKMSLVVGRGGLLLSGSGVFQAYLHTVRPYGLMGVSKRNRLLCSLLFCVCSYPWLGNPSSVSPGGECFRKSTTTSPSDSRKVIAGTRTASRKWTELTIDIGWGLSHRTPGQR
jgi:hypothetical protein